jgi:hypothetical protein
VEAEALTFQYTSGDRWLTHHPVVEHLKAEAQAKGLWNLFLPLSSQKHLPPCVPRPSTTPCVWGIFVVSVLPVVAQEGLAT